VTVEVRDGVNVWVEVAVSVRVEDAVRVLEGVKV
jgi:hypothetical protein